jgi:hypothetical protein
MTDVGVPAASLRFFTLAYCTAGGRILAQSLPPLSQEVISLLRQHGRLTISDLERLTRANKNTLKVRLRELTKAQQISRFGKARATWYELGHGGLPP